VTIGNSVYETNASHHHHSSRHIAVGTTEGFIQDTPILFMRYGRLYALDGY
jgi:hypothetical protein